VKGKFVGTSKVFTVVFQVEVFWNYPEDGGSTDL